MTDIVATQYFSQLLLNCFVALYKGDVAFLVNTQDQIVIPVASDKEVLITIYQRYKVSTDGYFQILNPMEWLTGIPIVFQRKEVVFMLNPVLKEGGILSGLKYRCLAQETGIA